jgi:hypothetical protein
VDEPRRKDAACHALQRDPARDRSQGQRGSVQEDRSRPLRRQLVGPARDSAPSPHVRHAAAVSRWWRFVAEAGHRPRHGPNVAFTWQAYPLWDALGGRQGWHLRPCSQFVAGFRGRSFLRAGRTVPYHLAAQLPWPRKYLRSGGGVRVVTSTDSADCHPAQTYFPALKISHDLVAVARSECQKRRRIDRVG